jgi:hypothetical protein
LQNDDAACGAVGAFDFWTKSGRLPVKTHRPDIVIIGVNIAMQVIPYWPQPASALII